MSNVTLPNDLAGQAEASAELDRLIAADAADQAKATGDSADDGAQRAAPAAETEALPDEKTDDTTPATAEAKTGDETPAGEAKSADKAAHGKPEKSRYVKAQERLGQSWEELNAQKAAFKAEQETFKAERARIEQERQSAEQAKAAEEFSPDQYEAAAKRFEADGKFDLAELAKAKADQLRRNPPVKPAEADAAARKEWALKAGVDFPELSKTNSPLQVRVSQLLTDEPDLKQHPKGIYLAARLANLEAEVTRGQTASASVVAKDKELGQLKAKVKELEALTAPGGGDGVSRLPAGRTFEQMSSDEQFAELERQAMEVGTLTR